MSEAVPAPAVPAAPAAPAPAFPAEGGTPAQNTAEQAPATAPEGEKPATDQDPEKQRGSRRFERRLDRAYKRAAEQQARADFLEKELAKHRQSAPPADAEAPKLENFKDIEEYATARAKHESEKAVKAHQAQQQSESHKREQTRLTEAWETKTERAGAKYEDFDEVVGDIKPTSPWAMAIMEAENGEDIAHHLGTNLKEANRIAALPPLSQIREIGRLEAKLAAEPPKPKTPSKAPAPITPVSGAAAVLSDTPSEQDSDEAWIRKRQKQVYGKHIRHQ